MRAARSLVCAFTAGMHTSPQQIESAISVVARAVHVHTSPSFLQVDAPLPQSASSCQPQRQLCKLMQQHNASFVSWQTLSAFPQLLQQWPQQQHWLQRKYSSQAAAVPSSRDLADILKLQLLQDKTADEVEHIWMTQHENSTSHVATVMSKDEHTVLAARAVVSPSFVLPLRKGPKGFCTLLIQWQQQQALITTLEEFRQLGSSAPTHFAMTCYTELAPSHGVVLVRGDVLNPRLISAPEARTVMELTRALYTDPESYQLAYQFNHVPEKFSFNKLLGLLGMAEWSNNK